MLARIPLAVTVILMLTLTAKRSAVDWGALKADIRSPEETLCLLIALKEIIQYTGISMSRWKKAPCG